MITHEELTQILNYDPQTGCLYWKSPRPKIKVGAKAGHLHRRGYINLEINGKHYAAHRIVWMYVTGRFPEKMLDHINGNKTDNRFENLREATNGQNRANSRTTNKHGLKGVRLLPWIKEGGRCWEAKITANGRVRYIGCFFSKEEAHQAYCEEAKKAHGEFAKF
jgi:hypothetical protein